MIKKLHIQNFQSHKDSTFEFDEGINVLIGRSDSGKSAVWRALYWLAFNSPSGEAYRSHWGGDTLVEIWLEDRTHIQRIRNKKENMYILNGMELKALRTEVPREISEALQLTDCNFQGQLDSSFLLMSSSGEVARVLNEYLDLQSIDKAIQDINGKNKKNSSELSALKGQEKQQEQSLLEPRCKRVEEFQMKLGYLKQDAERLEDKEQELQKLIALRKRHSALRNSLAPLKDIDKLLETARQLLKKSSKYQKLIEQKAILLQAAGRAREFSRKIMKAEEQIDKLEELKSELLEDVCPICGSVL